MNELMKPLSTWDDMWRSMDALMRYPFEENPLATNGLKSLIRRPHNLVNVKDDDGNVIAQRLEVVTTPFAKDEVKVSVEGNVLTVACGGTNKEEKTEDEYIYKGISSQSYTFQVRLGNSVDKAAIKAKNVDGVLTVMLPFKKKEDEPKQITQIEVE
jgi:HSP20 family molecular chaperone IbpA